MIVLITWPGCVPAFPARSAPTTLTGSPSCCARQTDGNHNGRCGHVRSRMRGWLMCENSMLDAFGSLGCHITAT